MVGARWSWKPFPNQNQGQGVSGKPTEEGQSAEKKGHYLVAIEGHFGERLYWECQDCGVTKRYARDIDESCPVSDSPSASNSNTSPT